MDDKEISSLSDYDLNTMYNDIIETPVLIADCKSGYHGQGISINGTVYYCCVTNYGNYYSDYYGCYSDLRLKEISGDNIAGLEEILSLSVKNYVYNFDAERTPHVGVIAQDLMRIFPNAVKEDENGYLKIRTEDMFYAMINAIKELNEQNLRLEQKIADIEKNLQKNENRELMKV